MMSDTGCKKRPPTQARTSCHANRRHRCYADNVEVAGLGLNDITGQYSYIADVLYGTAEADSFRPGPGPAILVGGPGRDTAYLPYASSKALQIADFGNGHTHIRYRPEFSGGAPIDIETIGIEKIVFSDRTVNTLPASLQSKDPNVYVGSFDFVADELTGSTINGSSNFYLPGAGDALINGARAKLDTLVIPANIKDVDWQARKDGSGFVSFSHPDGDGQHRFTFTEIDRLEFNDAAYRLTAQGKWKAFRQPG